MLMPNQWPLLVNEVIKPFTCVGIEILVLVLTIISGLLKYVLRTFVSLFIEENASSDLIMTFFRFRIN